MRYLPLEIIAALCIGVMVIPLFTIVAISSETSAVADDPPAADVRLIEALRSYIPHLMGQLNTPGLNIALARRGKVIWEEGFGYADLEKKIPMTSQTVFRSGSMGKTYTGTATMQLMEKGIIGLYDPINKYLKKFQVINPLGDREITFYDLLTHRSGLASNSAGSDFLPPKSLGEHLREDYPKKMFDNYKGTVISRWSAKAGEKFQYSNFGLATLGYLVEVINPEGLSFSDYIQKHIIDPLGMKSTQFPPVQDAAHVRPEIFARVSKGYAQFGQVHIPTPDIYFADFPAGTVLSIPGDHIRLLLAYLNKGSYNGYQLLKPETVRLMLSPRVKWDGSDVPLGLIWFLRNYGDPDYNFGHGGAHMYGWNHDFRAYPEQDFAVVVATNHWGMVTFKREPDLIANFISLWLKNEKKNIQGIQPKASWAWKTSYVMGLMIVEQLKGDLGIESPLTPEMIEGMALGAVVFPEAENGVPVWDPSGFRAGIEDMLAEEMTKAGIERFLSSKRLRVAPEELSILFGEMGGNGSPFEIMKIK